MVDGIRCNPISNRKYYLINESLLIPSATVLGTQGNKFNSVGFEHSPFAEEGSQYFKTTCYLPYVSRYNRIVQKWTWIEESYNITELQVGQKLIKYNGSLENVNSIRQITREEAISKSSHRDNFEMLYNFSVEGCVIWIDNYMTAARMAENWDYNTLSYIEDPVTVTHSVPSSGAFTIKRKVNIDWSIEEDPLYWNESLGAWDDSWKMKQQLV